MAALSNAEPGLPMDWRMSSRRQPWWHIRGVLAALIGVRHHPDHLAAAHCDGHREGSVGRLGVVVRGQREPDGRTRWCRRSPG
ncbi:hypothetical protein ACNTMW_24490 [Planosporangium sp. 12N6]|uniref:hypothetical protein n=1 Tax=Planosporangium spinosum TaxID=3402278 RepID=UPI003CF3BE14